MALACMEETPSAPPVGGGKSSPAPIISMTPVGPAPTPQFPPPQHRADGPGRGNANFSGPGHEWSHHSRGSRDERHHAQHYGQHHQGHRGARGQGFKRCEEWRVVAEGVVGGLVGGVGGEDSVGCAVAGGAPTGGVTVGGQSKGGAVGLGYDRGHGDTGRCVFGHDLFPAGGVGWRNTADLGPGVVSAVVTEPVTVSANVNSAGDVATTGPIVAPPVVQTQTDDDLSSLEQRTATRKVYARMIWIHVF